jgi:hypothetical protein
MFVIACTLLLTALASILGILNDKFHLRFKRTFPYVIISKKPRKHITIVEIILIIIASIGCIMSIKYQAKNIDDNDIANRKSDSLQKDSRQLQDSILKLNKALISYSDSNYIHTTRIKDSLTKKIDTVRGQNFQLSKQQFKSFDSTYKKISKSADTLLTYLTGKNGYCYFNFGALNGQFAGSLINPFGYNLHAGYVNIFNLNKLDSLRTNMLGNELAYNHQDYTRFIKTIDLNFIAPGTTLLDYNIPINAGVAQKFEVTFHFGTETFAQQVYFKATNQNQVFLMVRCYIVKGNKFVFKEDKRIAGNGLIDWPKEFTLPINRRWY